MSNPTTTPLSISKASPPTTSAFSMPDINLPTFSSSSSSSCSSSLSSSSVSSLTTWNLDIHNRYHLRGLTPMQRWLMEERMEMDEIVEREERMEMDDESEESEEKVEKEDRVKTTINGRITGRTIGTRAIQTWDHKA